MHVFITGIAGFLGSNLADFYLKKKFKVKSFRTNLSLSDEKNYAIAYVIIEKND